MEEKKKRKYFSNQRASNKKRRSNLESGMKGFLCTCNFREKDCIQEAYNLLNEYLDKIYESSIQDTDELNNFESSIITNKQEKIKVVTNDEDISIALNKEISELKAEALKPSSQKRFQAVNTGINNVIFIRSIIPDTLELLTLIIKDLNKTKKQKSRYLLRMLPVQIICKAYLNDIRLKVDVLFEQYFTQEPKTFSIIFKRHSNNNLQRQEVIEDLAKIILKKNPGNKANLKKPDIAVVVEVVKAMCLISIAPHYFTYKKYNLLEICKNKL